MNYTTFTFDLTQLNKQANDFVDQFIGVMRGKDIITADQAEEMSNYRIVIADKGFFGKLWDKFLFKSGNNNARVLVVKLLEADKLPVENEPETPKAE